MSSWRKGTKKQYSTYIKKWFTFCRQRQINTIEAPVNIILDFLTELYESGLGYSAINTSRSALSALGIVQDGFAIGAHPVVIRFMKGIFNLRPSVPRIKIEETEELSLDVSNIFKSIQAACNELTQRGHEYLLVAADPVSHSCMTTCSKKGKQFIDVNSEVIINFFSYCFDKNSEENMKRERSVDDESSKETDSDICMDDTSAKRETTSKKTSFSQKIEEINPIKRVTRTSVMHKTIAKLDEKEKEKERLQNTPVHSCDHCQSKFRTVGNLSKHMKNKHNIDPTGKKNVTVRETDCETEYIINIKVEPTDENVETQLQDDIKMKNCGDFETIGTVTTPDSTDCTTISEKKRGPGRPPKKSLPVINNTEDDRGKSSQRPVGRPRKSTGDVSDGKESSARKSNKNDTKATHTPKLNYTDKDLECFIKTCDLKNIKMKLECKLCLLRFASHRRAFDHVLQAHKQNVEQCTSTLDLFPDTSKTCRFDSYIYAVKDDSKESIIPPDLFSSLGRGGRKRTCKKLLESQDAWMKKTYFCKICHRKEANKTSLLQHMKKFHLDVLPDTKEDSGQEGAVENGDQEEEISEKVEDGDQEKEEEEVDEEVEDDKDEDYRPTKEPIEEEIEEGTGGSVTKSQSKSIKRKTSAKKGTLQRKYRKKDKQDEYGETEEQDEDEGNDEQDDDSGKEEEEVEDDKDEDYRPTRERIEEGMGGNVIKSQSKGIKCKTSAKTGTPKRKYRKQNKQDEYEEKEEQDKDKQDEYEEKEEQDKDDDSGKDEQDEDEENHEQEESSGKDDDENSEREVFPAFYNSMMETDGGEDGKDDRVGNDMLILNEETEEMSKTKVRQWRYRAKVFKRVPSYYVYCDHDDSVLENRSSQELPYCKSCNRFKCFKCTLTFKNASRLNRHVSNIHNKEKKYKCTQCEARFTTNNSLTNHRKWHTGVKDVECPICDKKFLIQKNLRKHINKHHPGSDLLKKKKANHCDICDLSFSRKDRLECHIVEKHPANNPQKECRICGQKFETEEECFLHADAHSNMAKVPVVKCPHCDLFCSSKHNLKRHIDRIHLNIKKYLCNECGKRFKGRDAFIYHVKRHKDPHGQDFECHICNKKIATKGGLEIHLRTHTGDKPYVCETCGKGFAQKVNMLSHQAIHNDARPFKCEECHRTFKKKFDLFKHMKRHKIKHVLQTGDLSHLEGAGKVYECPLENCKVLLSSTNDLKLHVRRHNNEKPYECMICLKTFAVKSRLIRHIRSICSRPKTSSGKQTEVQIMTDKTDQEGAESLLALSTPTTVSTDRAKEQSKSEPEELQIQFKIKIEIE